MKAALLKFAFSVGMVAAVASVVYLGLRAYMDILIRVLSNVG